MQIQPGGPAEKAGLKVGDIITTVDGRSIKDGDDLVNEITTRRPGSTIRLGYLRDGKPGDTTATIGDLDKVFADQANLQAEAGPDDKGDAGEAKLGMMVREISPSTTAKLHISGVLIQSVRSGSFADLQGLNPAWSLSASTNNQPEPRINTTPWSESSKWATTWSSRSLIRVIPTMESTI